MKIVVNGAEREIAAATLADALDQLDYGEAVVATAVNSHFVPVSARSSTLLTDGDQIEIVAPMQGG